jgi:hypothetical protein
MPPRQVSEVSAKPCGGAPHLAVQRVGARPKDGAGPRLEDRNTPLHVTPRRLRVRNLRAKKGKHILGFVNQNVTIIPKMVNDVKNKDCPKESLFENESMNLAK